MADYKAKHGVEYGEKPGVAAATRALLLPFKDAWQTVLSRL